VSERRRRRALQVACVLGLVANALMAWSVLEPTPVPIMVSMSAGQVIGTLSFLLYLMVVAADLRRARVLGDAPPEPPP